MSINFDTKYPTALKNSTWQAKKSFKDKTKSKTKTGLGEALAAAEKAWGAIDFDELIAGKQNLAGKSLAVQQAGKKKAQEYLDGPVMRQAIASLEAAASKAKTTGKNTSLSTTAAKAATALSGALLTQAKLLHDIKLDDFQAEMATMALHVGQWERQHTEALRSMDTVRDRLNSSKNKETWEQSNIGTVIENAVQITKDLSDETGDHHWSETNEKWRQLQTAYTAADRRVKSLTGSHVADEIDTFTDLVQNTLGGIWN